jgi:hypothetical protein
MLRLYSTEQALALRGDIHELTITRPLQFQSDGYDSEEPGHIIVIQKGDDISRVTVIGPEGCTDGVRLVRWSCSRVMTDLYRINPTWVFFGL